MIKNNTHSQVSVTKGLSETLATRRSRGLRWVYAAGSYGQLFGQHSPDWSDLHSDNRCELVKSNPLRQVFRVALQKTELYAKVYNTLNLRDQLKWRIRGIPAKIEFENLLKVHRRSTLVTIPIAWAYGQIGSNGIAILITKSLGQTTSLEDIIHRKNTDKQEISQVLTATGVMIGKMHRAGLFHKDLHPGNILLQTSADQPIRAFLTDFWKAHIDRNVTPVVTTNYGRRYIANIAMLAMALRLWVDQQQMRQFVVGYLSGIRPGRKYHENEIDKYLRKLNLYVDKHWRRHCASRARRALRDSRYAELVHLDNHWKARVFLRSKHPVDYSRASKHCFDKTMWQKALQNISNGLTGKNGLLESGEFLKKGGHNTVVVGKLQIGHIQLEVIAKHIRLHDGLRGWLQALARSRALAQWATAHALLTNQLPTIQPLAAIEKFKGPMLRESILIYEKIPDSINLSQYLLEYNKHKPLFDKALCYRQFKRRQELCNNIGDLLAQLTLAGYQHRDCKARNVLVQNKTLRLFLIDLDGPRKCFWINRLQKSCDKAIVRLAASVLAMPGVSRTDFGRVFNRYIKNLELLESHNKVLRKKLWRKISKQVQRKARKSSSFSLKKYQFDNILLIKPSSLGDVVRCLPILGGLRRRYPDSRISWLIRPEFAEILKENSDLDEIIEFDRKYYGKIGRNWSATRDFVRFIRELRRCNFDLVLDLQGLFRSGFMSFCTNAGTRLGFADARELAWIFYSHRVEMPKGPEHICDSYWRFAKLLGFGDLEQSYDIAVGPIAEKAAAELLVQKGLSVDDGYVVMLIGATEAAKRWPTRRFAELAEQMKKCCNRQTVLLGAGAQEKQLAEEVMKFAGDDKVVDLVDQTSLTEMTAIIKKASVVVGNDSGPLHIAAALGVPTIGIYGPTDPAIVGPYGQLDGIAQAGENVERRERYSKAEEHGIDRVTVECVMEKLRKKMEARSQE